MGTQQRNDSIETRFCAARQAAIASCYHALNPAQRAAVLHTEGPLLLLAGAGSGKTTALIGRIANLLRFGCGATAEDLPFSVTEEDCVFLEEFAAGHHAEAQARMEQLCAMRPPRPYEILAITFTNKAAREMKERLREAVGPVGEDVWASTFHAACLRILRRDITRLGFPSGFTIYDTDDSLRVMKQCLKELNVDDKVFAPRACLQVISRAKDEGQLSIDYEREHGDGPDARARMMAALYRLYEDKLWKAGALDFDDIILHTVRLLRDHAEVRTFYQKKFRYVLIDEYQDTNRLQYALARLLSGGYHNLCVVGDDDQSIYRFRGATIENILSFEEAHGGAKVIRLEQNYRSSGHILEAANAVIARNEGRKHKKLWTEAEAGSEVTLVVAEDEQDEARQLAEYIVRGLAQGYSLREQAVLYRMSAISNQLELALRRQGIAYKVVGGLRFFDRAEVKDALAYLMLLQNPDDDLRLLRVVNTPPRGIGAKAMEQLQQRSAGRSLWDTMGSLATEEGKESRALALKFQPFLQLITLHQQLLAEGTELALLYDSLLEKRGYLAMLSTKDNESRLENIEELKSSLVTYVAGEPRGGLGGFLDEVSLYTDLDAEDVGEDYLSLMTIHAAKGLEFRRVFVMGVEEGVFPGYRAIGEREELEEERRLGYLALTRAREQLTLFCAQRRMLFGKTTGNQPSRFLLDIPAHCMRRIGGETLPDVRGGAAFFGDEPRRGGSAYHAAPGTRGTQKIAESGLSLQVGDEITHKAFGHGFVMTVKPVGGDALLEVIFDTVGTKRLMQKTAGAYLTKL